MKEHRRLTNRLSSLYYYMFLNTRTIACNMEVEAALLLDAHHSEGCGGARVKILELILRGSATPFARQQDSSHLADVLLRPLSSIIVQADPSRPLPAPSP